jgi:hypothetical protein
LARAGCPQRSDPFRPLMHQVPESTLMTLASESTDYCRKKSRVLWAVGPAACLAVVLSCARPARAEDAETRTAARDLATQGAQAFDAGHYEQAGDLFLRAYELVHAPSIGLMRARSLVKLGRLLEAIDTYEQTAHFKLSAGAPDAYVHAVEAAGSEVEEARHRVPRLKITLLQVDANENPRVTIDDKPTPAALLGVGRPMDPGVHRVAVLVSGQTRATRELNLEEGKSYETTLDAAPDASARAALSRAKMADSSHASALTSGATVARMRLLGYASVGVGVVGLGLGTYTGLVALHHESELDAVCHPGCPQSSAADLDGFRSNRTVSWVSYGLGLAATATGVLLLTLGPAQREHVALSVLPNGVRIGGWL